MKASIVPSDGLVYVDGVPFEVDMTDLPSYAHAIQWYGVYGEVEFKPDREGLKLPNLRFTDFKPFEFMVDRWKQQKKREEERKQREEDEKMAKLAEYKAKEAEQRSEKPM